MDFFEFTRWGIKKTKLFVLYWRRIVFAKNHFKCPWYKKINANICGGFLADQWIKSIQNLFKTGQMTGMNTCRNSTGIVPAISTSRSILSATTRSLRQRFSSSMSECRKAI